jgi:hypothetical protein
MESEHLRNADVSWGHELRRRGRVKCPAEPNEAVHPIGGSPGRTRPTGFMEGLDSVTQKFLHLFPGGFSRLETFLFHLPVDLQHFPSGFGHFRAAARGPAPQRLD